MSKLADCEVDLRGLGKPCWSSIVGDDVIEDGLAEVKDEKDAASVDGRVGNCGIPSHYLIEAGAGILRGGMEPRIDQKIMAVGRKRGGGGYWRHGRRQSISMTGSCLIISCRWLAVCCVAPGAAELISFRQSRNHSISSVESKTSLTSAYLLS